MSEWFEFALYAVSKLVTTVFGWDIGLGFSLGDFWVASMVIGIIISALVLRVSRGRPWVNQSGRSTFDKRVNMDE